MKELESPQSLRPETELTIKVKQQKEFKLLGTTKSYLGHICFEVNTVTKEIKHAQYSKSDIRWDEATNIREKSKRVIINPDCIYRTALNKENLIKKLRKEGFVF